MVGVDWEDDRDCRPRLRQRIWLDIPEPPWLRRGQQGEVRRHWAADDLHPRPRWTGWRRTPRAPDGERHRAGPGATDGLTGSDAAGSNRPHRLLGGGATGLAVYTPCFGADTSCQRLGRAGQAEVEFEAADHRVAEADLGADRGRARLVDRDPGAFEDFRPCSSPAGASGWPSCEPWSARTALGVARAPRRGAAHDRGTLRAAQRSVEIVGLPTSFCRSRSSSCTGPGSPAVPSLPPAPGCREAREARPAPGGATLNGFSVPGSQFCADGSITRQFGARPWAGPRRR